MRVDGRAGNVAHLGVTCAGRRMRYFGIGWVVCRRRVAKLALTVGERGGERDGDVIRVGGVEGVVGV